MHKGSPSSLHLYFSALSSLGVSGRLSARVVKKPSSELQRERLRRSQREAGGRWGKLAFKGQRGRTQLNPGMPNSLCYQSCCLPLRSSPSTALVFKCYSGAGFLCVCVCDQREYLTPDDICGLSLMSVPWQPDSSAWGCSTPLPSPHPRFSL